jgi:hypothetical protein
LAGLNISVENKNGALGANRTRDRLLRRQMLYPTELRAQNCLAAKTLTGML